MHFIEIFKNKLREVALLLHQYQVEPRIIQVGLLDHYSQENCWYNDQSFVKRRVYTEDRNLSMKKCKTGS